MANMKGGLAGEQMMNQKKGKLQKKQEGKEMQNQFHPMQQFPMQMQYPMQQFQPNFPPMMPMGMQMPMQMQGMQPQQMHMGYPQGYQSPQVAELQKQIQILTQMNYLQNQYSSLAHQPMPQHDPRFGKQAHPQMPEYPHQHQMQQPGFPGHPSTYFSPQQQEQGFEMYGQMNPQLSQLQAQPDSTESPTQQEDQEDQEDQEEYEDEEQEMYQQDSQSANEIPQNKISKKNLKVPVQESSQTNNVTESKKNSPAFGKKSQKTTGSDSKNKNQDSPQRSKRNISDENQRVPISAKKAGNSKNSSPGETNIKEISELEGEANQLSSRIETVKSNLINSQQKSQVIKKGKGKAHEQLDQKEIIEDSSPVRRTTRSMVNKGGRKKNLRAQRQSPSKKGVIANQKQIVVQKSNSRSPKGSLKGKQQINLKKNAKGALQSQEESSQQITIRETRYSSRLSSSKQSSNIPASLKDKQKALQTLKDEIEAAEKNQRELLSKKSLQQKKPDSLERRQTRGINKKSPSKDELLLFGKGSDDGFEKSEGANTKPQHSLNPLLARHRKEAQTEIIDHKIDEDMQKQQKGTKSVYEENSEEEQENDQLLRGKNEEQYMVQLQKEKIRLQKQMEANIMDDQKLKDMSVLFGIPEEEVQEIQKKQREQLQKIKDQQMLFGDTPPSESPIQEVQEFSTEVAHVKKEVEVVIKVEDAQPARQQRKYSDDIQMTKVVADNQPIELEKSRERDMVKLEQDEMLLFGDQSTNQEQQKLIKDEIVEIRPQNTGQDIHIMLESQTPVDKEMKEEENFVPRMTHEDEQMLFSDVKQSQQQPTQQSPQKQVISPKKQSPVKEIIRAVQQAHMRQEPSMQMNQINLNTQGQSSSNNQAQGSSSENNNYIIVDNKEDVQVNMIQQEAEDTFKTDEQASIPMQQQMQQQQKQQSQLLQNQEQLQTPVAAIEVEEEEENQEEQQDGPDRSIYIDSMVNKQANLLQQIRELEQQIQKDQENIDEQNDYIKSAQKIQIQRQIEIEEQQQEIKQIQPMQIEEEAPMEINQNDQDALMNEQVEQEGQDFEVQLQADQNSNSNDINHVDQEEYIEVQQPEIKRDITELVDQLPLSDNFELLCTFQQALDQALNICHMRQMQNLYTNFKSIIQSQTGRQFTLAHLRQIFCIAPNYYNHHWEQRQGKCELVLQIPQNMDQILKSKDEIEVSQLSIDLPINSNMIRVRGKKMRQRLLTRVNTDFERFLEQKGHLLKQQEYDVFQTRRWPGAFDLNNPSLVSEMPLGYIKEQPQAARQVSVQEFIKKNDNHNQQIRDVVREEAQAQRDDIRSRQSDQSAACSDSSEEARRRAQKPGMQTGIRESTMAVVRMKDQMTMEAKFRNKEENERQETLKNIETMQRVSEQIKQIFTYEGGSLMKLGHLCSKISDSQRGQFSSNQQIKQSVETLQRICPDWIQFKRNVQGTYVKLHKNINYQHYQIKQRIQTYYANQASRQEASASQEDRIFAEINKRKERIDSVQNRPSQLEKEEQQRQAKSCPPNGQRPSQQSIQQDQGLSQSNQEPSRSYNQSAVSQKSNSLERRPEQLSQSINLKNQAVAVKPTSGSAFQPYQRMNNAPQNPSYNSENMINQQQSSSNMNQLQQSRGTSQVSQNIIENSEMTDQQQQQTLRHANNQLLPSSNSIFKQVTPQSQLRKQAQQHMNQEAPQQKDNNGSSGTFLTGSCESNKNRDLEGGAANEQLKQASSRYPAANNHNVFSKLGYPQPGAGHRQQNGVDQLLRQVMQSGEQLPPIQQNSPVKRDTMMAQQRQQSHHYDQSSISASIGVPQLGNDLYQGMTAHGGSSRGRGYSGSMFGGHPSSHAHHQATEMLNMGQDEDDDMELNHNGGMGNYGHGMQEPNSNQRHHEMLGQMNRYGSGQPNGQRIGSGQQQNYYR